MRSDDSSLPAMGMLIPAMKVILGDSSSTSNVNEINVSDCVDFTASNVTIKSFQ
ncbi:hypothetical protein [Acidovorax sp.]|uniref:hypothetical protein n=1 Tax=Acidovorax sp. TaxID=1872122 RepID=UPI0025C0AF0C|nr:hypothetical protein [Acidovorax sp.]